MVIFEPIGGTSERRSALIPFMMVERLKRGTAEAVFTGRIFTPFSFSQRTVVVSTLRGSLHSWQAKASPFGQRAPRTFEPSVSKAQQFGHIMQTYFFVGSFKTMFDLFCFFFLSFSFITRSRTQDVKAHIYYFASLDLFLFIRPKTFPVFPPLLSLCQRYHEHSPHSLTNISRPQVQRPR